MIIDRRTGAFHGRAREFVDTISSNAQKILTLIDNFLTCCKIEAGKLFINEGKVNLKLAFDDALGVLRVEAERNALTIHTELLSDPPTIVGDEHLLFRAICNLLSNAIKFTPQEGRIKITMKVVRRAASPLGCEALETTISNTGAGIPRAEIPLLFQKYKRLRDVGGPEGSGLGLYVVKYVIEAHHGRIEVRSIPNELTTFTFWLPIREN
jgi:signal transduction histidine kinase